MRTKYLLDFLKNPQNSFPVIHILGTSGKGSTATITASLLTAHGFKTGLHVSPHLHDVRERWQIDGNLVADEKIQAMLPHIQKAVTACQDSFFGKPTYFDVTIALMFTLFAQEKVDVAVVEAWCWWLLDGTNVVTRSDKICVITKQGFDHEEILGNTIEEITLNDAGAIQEKNTVISLFHNEKVCRDIIAYATKQKNANLLYVKPEETRKNISAEETQTTFTYLAQTNEEKTLTTNLIGTRQAYIIKSNATPS